jgi:hypothetical protein
MKPQRLGELVGDYTLYDVPTTCRDCGTEFVGKAFQPADERKRWGVCAPCTAIAEMPKLPPKPKDLDLHPPRRTWEQDH